MIGRTALERARVRELERIAELRALRPVTHVIHSTNSPLGYPPNPGIAAHFQKELPIGLRFLDERLSDGRHFIAGEQPSIADCTLAAAFKFARFLFSPFRLAVVNESRVP
ncbi:MAG: glutathione S-transferase C-terminal domain-containing protein [Burkholderiales bacterium]|nr:glutathione S-transferase C-terminal domain-containing protein [Burkholderiales bacterium]